MTATPIDGKAFADGLQARIGAEVAKLPFKPGLAVVLVGEDPASAVYVRSKEKRTVESGMASFAHRLPATTRLPELLALIAELNANTAVDGILVQLPLPAHLDSRAVIDAIDPAKDVDGLTIGNAGRLQAGLPALVPCTPLGCLLLLRHHVGKLAGLDAVVVGRSVLVGKPMATLLTAEDCTVTIAHSKTRDLPAVCRRADILVAAVGRKEMIQGDWIKPGATVIDVGINRVPTPDGKSKLIGDVAYAAAARVAGRITPVPGGVGPMTVACLMRNTLTAALRRRDMSDPAI
ncbi:MAG: bifunctional methylenetetrahydrofolate dehydrogenase/methenyltetrahydrofolate cyclohydrolase FolD [Alphaproteobacteria bacterium]|nr:bifunctional methylenetetrahydrofolate dehydrogenase/methenyltetrahydrofolate cyclohydrolase FolD [Alphaproteobacteria bacterium]